jgi:hypothetical protein
MLIIRDLIRAKRSTQHLLQEDSRNSSTAITDNYTAASHQLCQKIMAVLSGTAEKASMLNMLLSGQAQGPTDISQQHI